MVEGIQRALELAGTRIVDGIANFLPGALVLLLLFLHRSSWRCRPVCRLPGIERARLRSTCGTARGGGGRVDALAQCLETPRLRGLLGDPADGAPAWPRSARRRASVAIRDIGADTCRTSSPRWSFWCLVVSSRASWPGPS